MALLTTLSEAEASRLLHSYGLGLMSLRPLAAGSVNSNFFIEASTQEGQTRSLFARIYEEQEPSGAAFEVRVNQRLAGAGIPVARPIFTQEGEPLVMSGAKPFALFTRIEGEVLCLQRVSKQVARSVGRALAQVHLAPLGDLELFPSRFGFAEMRQRLDLVEAAHRPSLQQDVAELRRRVDHLESTRSSNLPSGLIHGDLFRDNVLIRDDEVAALLDFESASHGPFVYDLLVTLLAWCFRDELDAALAAAMVDGYCSVRPLEEREWAALVTEGSVACVRFATTRMTDFSLRVPEGSPPLRDYRRFFDRLSALEGGALERALSPLGRPPATS